MTFSEAENPACFVCRAWHVSRSRKCGQRDEIYAQLPPLSRKAASSGRKIKFRSVSVKFYAVYEKLSGFSKAIPVSEERNRQVVVQDALMKIPVYLEMYSAQPITDSLMAYRPPYVLITSSQKRLLFRAVNNAPKLSSSLDCIVKAVLRKHETTTLIAVSIKPENHLLSQE